MENSTAQDPNCINYMTDSDHEKSELELPPDLVTEDKMRRRLQFFFMNPIEKWHAKRRFPYKFIVQVVKIVLVTMQLCLFASSRYNHVSYTWDNRITFSHLFLKGWDTTREVNSYPPSVGPLAIYTEKDFFDTIDYAYKGYSSLSTSVGSYSYANEDNTPVDMVFCLYQYKEGIIYGFNESYIFNNEIIESCMNISRHQVGDVLDSETFMKAEPVNLSFSALVRADLMFSLKTVNFRAASKISAPNCYRFDITISFSNDNHDGQITLDLDADATRLMCKGDTKYITDNEIANFMRSLLNYLVITTCVISFILCARAVWRAQQLKNATVRFFAEHFDKKLTMHDRHKFLNMWYIMIIVNDILIVMGSAIKEQIESVEFTSDQWNICSLFLGIGNMLVWFGVLRYLGFFKTYNVVILTLQKSAPQVARFLICAVLIYAGFTFCGWLILGPYHLKFRSPSTTSECLFSLINGDDMFATFSIMSNKSLLLWWFCRIYLYSFISLYIYVILSLFIAVIMDAYETIKLYYSEGFPKSDLDMFIGSTNWDELSNGMFRSDSNDSLGGRIKDLCCYSGINAKYRTLSGKRFKRNASV